MVSANLQMAMQGLVVIPLFAGFDLRLKKGRIFTYDVTGGRFEETDFHATGSGGRDAKNTVKLSFRDRLGRDEAVEIAVAALYEAADEDTATGGPDPLRGIYPVVATVDAEGYRRLEDTEVAEYFLKVLERRRERGEGGAP
jgi:proteasome beta subunit